MGDALRDALYRAGLTQITPKAPDVRFDLVQPSGKLDLTAKDRIMLKTFGISAD